MRFVDEAIIKVISGKGGDGCLSFRREKYIPKGGPDGGDGGRGGHVYLKGHAHLNTLVDFRYKRLFRAKHGRPGQGSQCTGAHGEDLIVHVPVGTVVYDRQTNECIGDIDKVDKLLKVAQGGEPGRGNIHFKSSVNRAPRQFTKGQSTEERELRLELKVLADVGLLGLPNAGKSTFIRAVSAAKPKVADYPFTTLHPNLGVVSMQAGRSFVMADIPGLIEGAHQGAGLGIRFLKHLARTKLLLHMVDIQPVEGEPHLHVRAIEKELAAYPDALEKKPRWLVINKIDQVVPEEREQKVADLIQALDWQGPFFVMSGLTSEGSAELCAAVMSHIEQSHQELS